MKFRGWPKLFWTHFHPALPRSWMALDPSPSQRLGSHLKGSIPADMPFVVQWRLLRLLHAPTSSPTFGMCPTFGMSSMVTMDALMHLGDFRSSTTTVHLNEENKEANMWSLVKAINLQQGGTQLVYRKTTTLDALVCLRDVILSMSRTAIGRRKLKKQTREVWWSNEVYTYMLTINN